MNIEKYLIFNKYLLSLFGISDFRDLQDKLKDALAGVDSDGMTHHILFLDDSDWPERLFSKLIISSSP